MSREDGWCTPQSHGRSDQRAKRLRRTLVLAAAVLVAAVTLPLAALGGRSAAGSPVAGPVVTGTLPVQVQAGAGTYYVVRPGDSLAGIAARLDPGHVAAAESRLAAELGSRVVVPGEHVSFG